MGHKSGSGVSGASEITTLAANPERGPLSLRHLRRSPPRGLEETESLAGEKGSVVVLEASESFSESAFPGSTLQTGETHGVSATEFPCHQAL